MEQATDTIPARPTAIRHLLLDALALPEWNEAFLDIEGPPAAAEGSRYALRVRPGLSGELRYTAVEPDRIEITWQVPGFREVGTWAIGAGQPGHPHLRADRSTRHGPPPGVPQYRHHPTGAAHQPPARIGPQRLVSGAC